MCGRELISTRTDDGLPLPNYGVANPALHHPHVLGPQQFQRAPGEIEAAERDIRPPDIHFEIDDVQKYFPDSRLKGYEPVFVLADSCEQLLGPLVEFLCQV